MKKTILIPLLLAVTIAFAQKKIICKKGSIKAESVALADYDGKGGWFKIFKLGVFAPGSKDTIFKITETPFNPQNPLFDGYTFYKLEFTDPSKEPVYIKGQTDSRLMENAIMGLVFNDSLPPLIQEGKLNDAALEALKAKKNFPFDKYIDFIKKTEDTLAVLNAVAITRDPAKPLVFTAVNDNSFKALSLPGSPLINQTLEITQDGIRLGRVQKLVTGGEYGKAIYVFWKYVGPHEVNGIKLSFSPVAISDVSPNNFGAATEVVPVISKKAFGVKPGAYQSMETTIGAALVTRGLL